MSEADWRHDFDRLLFDFFKRVKVDENAHNPGGRAADVVARASEPTELTKAHRYRQGSRPEPEPIANPLDQLQGSDLQPS